MGGPIHEYGPIWVCLHWDEHPRAIHAWGTCVWPWIHGVNLNKIYISKNPTEDHPVLFLVIFPFLQLHKQQSRGELSRHTWHRQESDESSDSVPDEVRSEPHAHSRKFPRSHTFPTMVPSPSGIPTSASASACTGLSKEGASSHSNTQRRSSGPATGTIFLMIRLISRSILVIKRWQAGEWVRSAK